MVNVLTDIPGPLGRVFLETAQNTRAFGNFWIPNDAIIFKSETLSYLLSITDVLLGVHGRLEGETIAGAAIQDAANLLYFEESPLPPAPQWVRSSRIQYGSFMPASPRSFMAGEPIQDWREPIRRMLQPLNVSINIRITANPHSDTSPTCSTRDSPNPTVVSSNSDGSLLRTVPS